VRNKYRAANERFEACTLMAVALGLGAYVLLTFVYRYFL